MKSKILNEGIKHLSKDKKLNSLINEFEKLTNIPVVLNTSLNVKGDAIVNDSDDATIVYNTSANQTMTLTLDMPVSDISLLKSYGFKTKI